MQVELTIQESGGLGDGIAEYRGKPVFVPFTCAGDVVKAHIEPSGKDSQRATVVEIVTASPDRRMPPCRHFTACGGCSLQHLNAESYRGFKRGSLEKMLAPLGIGSEVIAPLVEVGAASRRRVEFKVQVAKGQVRLGFFAPQSHQMVDLQECPVTEAAITRIMPALKDCLQTLKKPGRIKAVGLTVLDHGLDAVLVTDGALHAEDKERLIGFAKEYAILRLSESAGDDTHVPVGFYDSGKATLTLGEVEVAFPAGGFVQASRLGQQEITARVVRYLGGCRRVADLYAGCGTYSFPLAMQCDAVSAFEGSAEMVAAMHNAILRHGLDVRMRAESRDLYARPLTAAEIDCYDGVVINPPRNGALPQVKAIAASNLPKLAMVSCNPATFLRDAKHLLAHGYRLAEVTPNDQFTWSAHLELVALFTK